jgi:hypothetical protein
LAPSPKTLSSRGFSFFKKSSQTAKYRDLGHLLGQICTPAFRLNCWSSGDWTGAQGLAVSNGPGITGGAGKLLVVSTINQRVHQSRDTAAVDIDANK